MNLIFMSFQNNGNTDIIRLGSFSQGFLKPFITEYLPFVTWNDRLLLDSLYFE